MRVSAHNSDLFDLPHSAAQNFVWCFVAPAVMLLGTWQMLLDGRVESDCSSPRSSPDCAFDEYGARLPRPSPQAAAATLRPKAVDERAGALRLTLESGGKAGSRYRFYLPRPQFPRLVFSR